MRLGFHWRGLFLFSPTVPLRMSPVLGGWPATALPQEREILSQHISQSILDRPLIQHSYMLLCNLSKSFKTVRLLISWTLPMLFYGLREQP